jgi:hypothetical protein
MGGLLAKTRLVRFVAGERDQKRRRSDGQIINLLSECCAYFARSSGFKPNACSSIL